MQLLRIAFSAFVVTALMVVAVILSDFRQRLEPRMEGAAATRIGVVFTGKYDRIDAALALFDQGKIDRLLISGVGPGSGLRPATLADQFEFSPRARAAMTDGLIQLSPDSRDTFQNAAETACWYRTLQAGDGIVLITSPSHMPRASITLERALPYGTPVYRFTPPRTPIDDAARQAELGKYVFSWIGSLLPGWIGGRENLSLCTDPPATGG